MPSEYFCGYFHPVLSPIPSEILVQSQEDHLSLCEATLSQQQQQKKTGRGPPHPRVLRTWKYQVQSQILNMCKLKVGFLVIFISLFLTTGKSSQNVTQVKYCNIKICLNISIKKYCTNGKRRNIKYNARTCTVYHQNVHQ